MMSKVQYCGQPMNHWETALVEAIENDVRFIDILRKE